MSLHLEHLNPEQLAAVTLPEGHALILAGAGSGKWRVTLATAPTQAEALAMQLQVRTADQAVEHPA